MGYTEFKKGDYIVVLKLKDNFISSCGKENFCFKQREDCSYIRPVLDLSGSSSNGHLPLLFNKKEKLQDWRYATSEEIQEYDRLGRAYDVTTLDKYKFLQGLKGGESIYTGESTSVRYPPHPVPFKVGDWVRVLHRGYHNSSHRWYREGSGGSIDTDYVYKIEDVDITASYGDNGYTVKINNTAFGSDKLEKLIPKFNIGDKVSLISSRNTEGFVIQEIQYSNVSKSFVYRQEETSTGYLEANLALFLEPFDIRITNIVGDYKVERIDYSNPVSKLKQYINKTSVPILRENRKTENFIVLTETTVSFKPVTNKNKIIVI